MISLKRVARLCPSWARSTIRCPEHPRSRIDSVLCFFRFDLELKKGRFSQLHFFLKLLFVKTIGPIALIRSLAAESIFEEDVMVISALLLRRILTYYTCASKCFYYSLLFFSRTRICGYFLVLPRFSRALTSSQRFVLVAYFLVCALALLNWKRNNS